MNLVREILEKNRNVAVSQMKDCVRIYSKDKVSIYRIGYLYEIPVGVIGYRGDYCDYYVEIPCVLSVKVTKDYMISAIATVIEALELLGARYRITINDHVFTVYSDLSYQDMQSVVSNTRFNTIETTVKAGYMSFML